ncbi:MAG: serine/threonine-protein kinase, partial [Myxococcota bacterium]
MATQRTASPLLAPGDLRETVDLDDTGDHFATDYGATAQTADLGERRSFDIGPGSRIYQYEIIRALGEGGMGTVFLARDLILGRLVALKFLRRDVGVLAERFLREARATARAAHENIVVIHEIGDFRGTPFMVLEYLRGQLLSELLAGGAQIPASRAVELMVPVVRALQCAHEHRIVHRDLKPENIIVTDSGTVKVLDFGIAKFAYGDDPSSLLTTLSGAKGDDLETLPLTNGAMLGTLPYMSPEQWGTAPIDHRSDIWAVGIILFRMVTGRHPLTPLEIHDLAHPSRRSLGHRGLQRQSRIEDVTDQSGIGTW